MNSFLVLQAVFNKARGNGLFSFISKILKIKF